MDCLVSIIMPVYGVEKYIKESIISVINQTYNNIELIVVDDETKDNSIEIASRVLSQSNIKYHIVSEKNKGLPGARNFGYRFCKGKYVCFIDSDDMIAPDHISNLVRLAEANQLSVVFSDFENTSENCRIGTEKINKGTILYSKEEFLIHFMERKPAVHCCSLLLKRKILDDNSIEFNEKLKYGEDAEFMWRVFSLTGQVGRVKEKTYKYLIRQNSIMTTVGIERGRVFSEELHKTMKDLAVKYPENGSIYDLAYCRYMLGWLKTVAIISSYDIFEACTEVVDYHKIAQELLRFPDKKVRAVAFVMGISKRLFYQIFHRNIRKL